MKTIKISRMLAFVVLGVILLAVVIGCERKEDPTPQPKTHTVVTTTNGGGNVTPLGKTEVLENKTLIVNFSPNSGYVVDVLSIDGNIVTDIPTDFTYSFLNVNSDHKFEVVFKKSVIIKKQYTVTANSGPGGTINPSGTMLVDSATSKSFVITPDPGYKVQSISVNNETKSPLKSPDNTTPYIISSVNRDYNINVAFEKTLASSLMRSWKQDSLNIRGANGIWEKNGYGYNDVTTFLSDGRLTIYRDGVLIGDVKWSLDETKTPAILHQGMTVDLPDGTTGEIERLDSTTLILAKYDVVILGDPFHLGAVRIVYSVIN